MCGAFAARIGLRDVVMAEYESNRSESASAKGRKIRADVERLETKPNADKDNETKNDSRYPKRMSAQHLEKPGVASELTPRPM
jgi:hypothetical protein